MSPLLRRFGRVQAPAGCLSPTAADVGSRVIRVGELWRRTLIVAGYPREVGNGWLEPLLTHPGATDVSLHVEPVPQAVAAATLRR